MKTSPHMNKAHMDLIAKKLEILRFLEHFGHQGVSLNINDLGADRDLYQKALLDMVKNGLVVGKFWKNTPTGKVLIPMEKVPSIPDVPGFMGRITVSGSNTISVLFRLIQDASRETIRPIKSPAVERMFA